ncbi:unnamed protein product [Brassica oleracea var. botrytis]
MVKLRDMRNIWNRLDSKGRTQLLSQNQVPVTKLQKKTTTLTGQQTYNTTDENRKCYNLGMRCRRRGRKVISQINTMLGLVMVCN